jgi:hypothetical protein
MNISENDNGLERKHDYAEKNENLRCIIEQKHGDMLVVIFGNLKCVV